MGYWIYELLRTPARGQKVVSDGSVDVEVDGLLSSRWNVEV